MKKYKNPESNVDEVRKCCKDVFHAFMVKGANYDGFYDMPIICQKEDLHILKLVSYDKTYMHEYEIGEVVHFYIDDYRFDGPKGIWNGLTQDISYRRGFDINRLKGAAAIITPDFSLYLDMPRSMQIWNVYRSRSVGYYLSSLGYNVIPNVRWTDEESYSFAFDGIGKGSIVAVGTLGCAKNVNDKNLFVNGFMEMIKRIEPTKIIIYGPIIKELNIIIKKYSIKVINFESDISMFYGGAYHGNESK